MNFDNHFSRRSLIVYSSAMAGLIGFGTASAAHADARTPLGEDLNTPAVRTSANGWDIAAKVDAGQSVWTHQVQGTPVSVEIGIGSPAILFTHLLQRYHYEIDELRENDVVGFKGIDQRSGSESNHASGTAIDIRPSWYPIGVSGGYTEIQSNSVRSILDDFDGVMRWGADFDIVDESHFEIVVGPRDKKLEKLMKKLREHNATLGVGGRKLE